jgi:hypothetical protein
MHLIIQLGISKRPCFSSGGGIRHLEQLFFAVVGRMIVKRQLTGADQSRPSPLHPPSTSIRWRTLP